VKDLDLIKIGTTALKMVGLVSVEFEASVNHEKVRDNIMDYY
jgi:hypothetical protein